MLRKWRAPCRRVTALFVFSLLPAGPASAVQEEQPKPPDFEAVITRALDAQREGRSQDAIAAFRQAARLEPNHPRVHYSLAWLLFQKGRLTESLSEVEQAIALDSKQALFHFLRGSIFHSMAASREAEKAYLETVRLDPQSGEAYLALADLYLLGEQYQKSADTLRSYLELHPDDVQALYFLGGVLSDQKKSEEALEVFNNVLDAKPDHARAWFRKGFLEARGQKTREQALVSFEKSIELDPSYPYTFYEYGNLLGKLGRTEEAIEALKKACEIGELSESVYALGNLLSRAGRAEEARAYLDRFKSMRDDELRDKGRQRLAISAFGTGREMLEENRLEEAIAAFEEMTELDPKSHQGYAFLAKTYASMGQVDIAVAYVRRAMELSPGTSEYPYLLSVFLKIKRDFPGARAAIRQALMLDPQNGLLHNTLGVVLSDMRDDAGALAAFEMAAELDPEDPSYRLNLAAAYDKLGETQKSIEAMEKYRELLIASIRS